MRPLRISAKIKQGNKCKSKTKGNSRKIFVMIFIKKFHHHPETIGCDPEKDCNVNINIMRFKRFVNKINRERQSGKDH